MKRTLQMLVCPTCDGSGAGTASIKGGTCTAGQCPDCRMTGEVNIDRWERLTGQHYPGDWRTNPELWVHGTGPTPVMMGEKQMGDGLNPGHYVTTDFLCNEGCKVIAGPFRTQDEAREHRTELEECEGHSRYFLERVRG